MLRLVQARAGQSKSACPGEPAGSPYSTQAGESAMPNLCWKVPKRLWPVTNCEAARSAILIILGQMNLGHSLVSLEAIRNHFS